MSVQFDRFGAFKSATEKRTEIFDFLYNKTETEPKPNRIEIFATVRSV